MSLRIDAPLRFHQLAFMPDGDETIVGRTDVDSYALFPEDGTALLRELLAGRTPPEAASWYQEHYGEPIDIDEFLATLREFNFVQDEGAAGPDVPAVVAAKVWQRLGCALFSVPAWGCYVMLLCAAVVVCVADPKFVPHRRYVFFSPYLLV